MITGDAMETTSYPAWNPNQAYAKGDRVVHEDRLYVAAESVTGTVPAPTSSLKHWPWVLLGRHKPL
jgi:chitodextrinase